MTPRTPRLAPLALAVALAAGLHPLGAGAQEPGAQFGEEVEVSEALLDVLVTDRQGNVVLGIGPRDFRVTVDGEPAEVTGATFYSNRRFLDGASAEALGVDPAAVPDRRLFLLFLEDQGGESLSTPDLRLRQLDAVQTLTDWLRRELLPNDLAAVVSFDSALRFHQDFTNDLDAILGAVERAGRGEEGIGTWPSRRADASHETPSLAAGLPQGEELLRETPDMYRALTVVGRALAPIPGRKNLVLLTSGFGEPGQPGGFRHDSRYRNPMVEALNGANAAVYAIDLMPARVRHSLQGSLTDLATSTGGDSFLEVLRFGTPLERIARETNGYYLVSVRTEPGSGAGYRTVEVTTTNPEFRVRARGGLQLQPVEPASNGG